MSAEVPNDDSLDALRMTSFPAGLAVHPARMCGLLPLCAEQDHHFFPWEQSKTILGKKQDMLAREVEDIKKTGRGVYPGPEVSRPKMTVDVSTFPALSQTKHGHMNLNVLGEMWLLALLTAASYPAVQLKLSHWQWGSAYNLPTRNLPEESSPDAQVPNQPQQNPSHTSLGLMTENVWS